MVILGHPDIPFAPLHYVESVEEIAKTPAGSVLWLGPYGQAKSLARHCFDHRLPYAVMAESLADALKANALGARYILAPETLAPAIQKAADHYLFDAKILLPVEEEAQMEKAARDGIDGVIFPTAIIFESQG